MTSPREEEEALVNTSEQALTTGFCVYSLRLALSTLECGPLGHVCTNPVAGRRTPSHGVGAQLLCKTQGVPDPSAVLS